jgi:hypothetical protein
LDVLRFAVLNSQPWSFEDARRATAFIEEPLERILSLLVKARGYLTCQWESEEKARARGGFPQRLYQITEAGRKALKDNSSNNF